ncbi:MAG: CpsD/CapB family tyrosine-protein kinase [Clostridia bacterium]|nr:CpsD/CapB family tyrosine-protein kinase [Clostridia bacterium]MBO7250130.1 CpsD/CapB family tyrosine-protein kinase [Clostridia bacterium]
MKLTKKKKVVSREEHLISDTTPFSVKESFNLLRTNIIYSATNSEGAAVYGISSATAASGKSTVIANLAISLANMSKRVLLVDADMRCPVQSKLFGYKKEATGLSEILSGIIKNKAEAIITLPQHENLFIIPSGFIPPNPAELLMSAKFRDLVAELKGEFDIILFDFPPIGVVTDSIAAVECFDGYIFVVRSGVSKIGDIKQSISQIETLGGKIVGIVLNGVESSEKKYGKYYGYGKYSTSYHHNS